MREIKFRGKDGGDWWYVTPDQFIRWKHFWADVDRETVGEYIGIKDKHGKEVYEGDSIKATLVETGELKPVIEKVFYAEQYACYMPFGYLMPFDEGRWIDCLFDGFEIIE